MGFLGYEDIWDLPDPKFFLSPFIPERSITLLYGQPGLGKSTIALGWLTALSIGAEWMGYPVSQVPVVNCWVEGHFGDIKKRHMGVVRQYDGEMATEYLWAPEAVNLFDPKDVENFCVSLENLPEEPKVISFDSFHRCTTGADENSAKDMGIVLASVDRIREQFGASVLLVHHPRKDGAMERGHSSLKAAVDVQVAVKARGSNVVLVETEKNRGGPEVSLYLRRTQVSTPWGSTVVMEHADSPEQPMVDEVHEAILGALNPSADVKTIVKELKGLRSRAQVYRDLADLEAQGRITKGGKGWHKV